MAASAPRLNWRLLTPTFCIATQTTSPPLAIKWLRGNYLASLISSATLSETLGPSKSIRCLDCCWQSAVPVVSWMRVALRQTKGVAFGKRCDAGCRLDGCVPFDFSFLWHMIYGAVVPVMCTPNRVSTHSSLRI